MRAALLLATACLLPVGCSTPVREATPVPAASVVAPATAPCVPPKGPVARPDFCSLPADVRAFVQDRDGCDHWRGEPWPEEDDEYGRQRRQEILRNVRTLCAGTDQALEALRGRYQGDATITELLAEFERNIERTP